MENHIIIGLFRGNKVMVQKNMMKEQRITNQNQEVEEKGHFSGMLSCIRGFTVQKENIHMHEVS